MHHANNITWSRFHRPGPGTPSVVWRLFWLWPEMRSAQIVLAVASAWALAALFRLAPEVPAPNESWWMFILPFVIPLFTLGYLGIGRIGGSAARALSVLPVRRNDTRRGVWAFEILALGATALLGGVPLLVMLPYAVELKLHTLALLLFLIAVSIVMRVVVLSGMLGRARSLPPGLPGLAQRVARVLLPLVTLGLIAVACRALYAMDFTEGALAIYGAAMAAALWSFLGFPGYAIDAIPRTPRATSATPRATSATPRFATRGQVAIACYAKALLRQIPQMLIPMIYFVPTLLLQSPDDKLRFSPFWIGYSLFMLMPALATAFGPILRPLRVLPLRTQTLGNYALLPPLIVGIPILALFFWLTYQQSNDLFWSLLLMLVLGLFSLVGFTGSLWSTLHQWLVGFAMLGQMIFVFLLFSQASSWFDRWPLVVLTLLFSVECLVLLRLLYRRYFWTSELYRAIRQDPKKERQSVGSPAHDELWLGATYILASLICLAAFCLHVSRDDDSKGSSPPADCIPCEEEAQTD